MKRKEDIFAGHVKLTATQKAYLAYALQELYMSGRWIGRDKRRDIHEAVMAAVLGPLRMTQMVTPDGTAHVTPKEHAQLVATPPVPDDQG